MRFAASVLGHAVECRVTRLLLIAVLTGCSSAPLPPVMLKPPEPPPYVMGDCGAWPAIDGSGRVGIEAAAAAVREAKESHADCRARLHGAQQYIRAIAE